MRGISATAPWTIGLLVACAACLSAHSGAEWLSGALIVAWFVTLDRALGLPPRAWIPAAVRWLLPVSVVVAAVGLLLPRARSGSWLSPTVVVELVVLLGVLAAAVWSRQACRGMSDAPVMQFPLPEGPWYAIEGEGRLLNHHWRAPAQRAALDLVLLGDNGLSHRTLRAQRVDSFFAYGIPVHSPCDGVIAASRDGDEDRPTPGAHAAGNHVVIDAAGVQVVLGHFAKGTVLVATGQRVQAGEALARIGNSGNSTEPHLHIHAQRDGRALRLRFAGQRRRLPRGATITG